MFAPPYIRQAALATASKAPAPDTCATLAEVNGSACVYRVACPFAAGLLLCRQAGGCKDLIEQTLGVNGFPA
ncbi:hypothetical protein StoSoilB13_05730 [Arthrobacter sp. StoSoilB13]|nr:hypothetical protein StoSoilB13_05730 [Arthrobacter sp. StoSoilB13]